MLSSGLASASLHFFRPLSAKMRWLEPDSSSATLLPCERSFLVRKNVMYCVADGHLNPIVFPKIFPKFCYNDLKNEKTAERILPWPKEEILSIF
jgi:hypothetical protein